MELQLGNSQKCSFRKFELVLKRIDSNFKCLLVFVCDSIFENNREYNIMINK